MDTARRRAAIRERSHPLRWRLEGAAAGAGVAAFQALPEPAALALGARLGRAFARLDSHYRRLALGNLSVVFPERSPGERHALLQESFAELGRCAAEWARLPRWGPAGIASRVEIRGREHLEKAWARGRGALVVTAHYGNWELILPATVALLQGREIGAVGRPQPNPRLQALVAERRGLGGARVLPQEAVAVLRALRRNAAVGVLADHYLSPRRGGILVPFLGRLAWTNPGPATLALRSGCALLVAHARRTGPTRHRIDISPELALPSGGSLQADIAEATARINRALGAPIRERPVPWLWANHRWRGSPGLEPGVDDSRRRRRRP